MKKLISVAAFAVLVALATVLKGAEEENAYKNIKWSDSIDAATKKIGECREWYADKFGIKFFNFFLEQVTNNEEYLKQLRDVFIIRMLSFEKGDSQVFLYWLEENDKNRKSDLIDKILYSDLTIVRIVFKEKIPFEGILTNLEDRYGVPEKIEVIDREFWDGMKRADYQSDIRKYIWKKEDLVTALYDLRDENLGSELVKFNKKAGIKFESAVEKEFKAIRAKEEKEKKNALKKVLDV